MDGNPRPREGIRRRMFGLSRHDCHQAARVVASASTDAIDCAQLLAALGLDPADWTSFDHHDR